MAPLRRPLLLALAALPLASGVRTVLDPMFTELLNELQSMKKELEAERLAEEKLRDAGLAPCKLITTLGAAIDNNQRLVSGLSPDIFALERQKGTLDARVQQANKDLSDAHRDLVDMVNLTDHSEAVHEREVEDLRSFIQVLDEAIRELQTGIGQAEFVQTKTAGMLRKLLHTDKAVLLGGARTNIDHLYSYVSGGDGVDLGVNEVIGILRELKEGMELDVQAAKQAHEGQIAKYTRDQGRLQQEIRLSENTRAEAEDKIVMMIGALSTKTRALNVANVTMKNDKVALETFKEDCSSRRSHWEQAAPRRNAELEALSEIIRMLTDDNLKDFFSLISRHTVRNTDVPEFMQVAAENRVHARAAKQSKRKWDLDAVITLIEDRIKMMDKERADDAIARQHCDELMRKLTVDVAEADTQARQLDAITKQKEREEQEAAGEVTRLEGVLEDLNERHAASAALREQEQQLLSKSQERNKNLRRLLGQLHDRLSRMYRRKTGETVKVDHVRGAGPASTGCRHYRQRSPTRADSYGYVLCLAAGIIEDLGYDVVDSREAETAKQEHYMINMANSNATRKDMELLLVKQRFERSERYEYLEQFKTRGRLKALGLNNTNKDTVVIQDSCANFEQAIFDERQQAMKWHKLQLELALGNLTDARLRQSSQLQVQPLEGADATAGPAEEDSLLQRLVALR